MQPRRRHHVYDIEELCALEDTGNHWLVRNMLPRVGRTIVWGEGGTFKTTLLFDLLVAVASGGALLRQFPVEEHGPVFAVSAEGSKYTNRDRILSHIRAREAHSPELVARGGKIPLPTVKDVPLYYCQQAYLLDDPHDLAEFREDVARIKPKVIMLDPLDSFLEGDENSAKETKAFRRALDDIIDEFELCVVIVHHSTKSQENPTLRGSGAWRGWIDTSLYFRKRSVEIVKGMPAIRYVEVESRKQRDGIEGHIFNVLPEFDSVRRTTTYTVIDNAVDPDILMRNTVQQHVLTTLQMHGPCVQNDLSALTGYSYKRISAALQDLQIDGLIDNKAYVHRSTSPDGSRQRRVQAWQSLVKTSLVDAAIALLKAKRDADEAELERYHVTGFGPPPPRQSMGLVAHGHDGADRSAVLPVTVQAGPGLQTLH